MPVPGRLTLHGVCSNTAAEAASVSSVVVGCARINSNSGIGNSGYSSEFALKSPVVHKANYYDGYDFRTLTGFNNANFHSPANSGKGFLTASVTNVLENGVKLYSATYTYDHAGRTMKIEHTLNGVKVTLANYTYDNFGRLQSKSLHGSAVNKLTHAYNLRSWLTGIISTPFTQSLFYNTGSGIACYNGNISSMTWKAGAESTIRGYKFSYDGLSRLTTAAYGEASSINTNLNRFTENITGYDKNGNITALQRYGQTSASAYGLIDNLAFTLSGNQLNRVDDAVTTAAYNNGFEFKNGTGAAGEYTYDANGNLTKDLNKGITGIQYNVLNLPSVVTFSDGSTISYTYSADGTKLRTAHKIGATTTTTDYCGNVIYENGVPKHLLTQEGYVSLNDSKYHYYLQDHQGNNRVVVNQSGAVEETSHYYPFGGVFATTGNVHPYKYNGKEFDAKKGLNWYDYGARHYDAALGRFTTVDPLAEKYGEVSPYAYCLNNPINRIDPDGKQVIPIPIPTPMPLPLYYFPYQPSYSYPSDKEIVVAVNQGISNVKTSIRNGLLFWGAAAIVAYGQTKEALKPSPEYGHQRNRDRRNKEGLDQNQASIAKSIENNVTATMPSGDPMPKRNLNDGGKKTKIGFGVIGAAASARAGLELTNPDPSKDAVEAHTKKVQQPPKKTEQGIWDKIVNWIK